LSISAVALVLWLIAAASGPRTYSTAHAVIRSWTGQLLLFGGISCFFLHLCGGIRHLIWDAGYGFELRTIYASGWTVVVTSVVLTLVTWAASMWLAG